MCAEPMRERFLHGLSLRRVTGKILYFQRFCGEMPIFLFILMLYVLHIHSITFIQYCTFIRGHLHFESISAKSHNSAKNFVWHHKALVYAKERKITHACVPPRVIDKLTAAMRTYSLNIYPFPLTSTEKILD